jgi:hypothetical protein
MSNEHSKLNKEVSSTGFIERSEFGSLLEIVSESAKLSFRALTTTPKRFGQSLVP